MASTPATNYSTKKEEHAAVIPQLFRPIKFESKSPSPATPEGIEPSISKGTVENGSESSSESAMDSAYSSDNLLPPQGEPGQITAVLQNRRLWKDFRKIGNEMIVTKPGRRLFPSLLVSLSGLDPNLDYILYLKVATADNQRYRYINMKWCATGESEVIQSEEKQTFRHPSSPNSGQFWMKRPISFKSIKITHYAKSQHGNILLHTMHKYIMKIVVDPTDGSGATVIPLPESTFIAVSAYQNVAVTQLKIDKNPFAKGFRYKVRVSNGVTPRSTSSCSNGSINGGTNGDNNAGGTSGIINGNPSNGNTSNVIVITSSSSALVVPPPPPLPPVPRETPMLTYWQQLHMQQGLMPQYNPGILAVSPNVSLQSSADFKESSPTNQPNSFNCSTHIATMTNGIGPHYPVFYNPYLPATPPYIVPTIQVGELDETKEAITKVDKE